MAEPGQPVGGRRPRRIGMLTAALTAGFAGGLIAPLLYPALARNARPATKKVMKLGIAAVERGRVVAAEFGEHASDLLAEAQAEYERERNPPSGGAQRAAPSEAAMEVVNLREAGRGSAGD